MFVQTWKSRCAASSCQQFRVAAVSFSMTLHFAGTKRSVTFQLVWLPLFPVCPRGSSRNLADFLLQRDANTLRTEIPWPDAFHQQISTMGFLFFMVPLMHKLTGKYLCVAKKNCFVTTRWKLSCGNFWIVARVGTHYSFTPQIFNISKVLFWSCHIYVAVKCVISKKYGWNLPFLASSRHLSGSSN